MRKQALLSSKKYDIQTTTETLLSHYQRLVDAANLRKKSTKYKVNRLLDKFQ
jgi:hypothetical protein